MWILVIIAIGVITGYIDILISGSFGDVSAMCSTMLLHQFVITYGLIGVIGVITNIIKAEDNAKALGWPGGPFQIKYGFSQFGIGLIGIMCIWFRGRFWLGALITMYVYGISGLWSHIAEMKRQEKIIFADMVNIVVDILYQVILTILSIYAGGIW